MGSAFRSIETRATPVAEFIAGNLASLLVNVVFATVVGMVSNMTFGVEVLWCLSCLALFGVWGVGGVGINIECQE